MNIYEKMQTVKTELQKANLKKTGKNDFAKYTYYELSDFLPTIVELCEKHKLFTLISFTEEVSMLTIVNAEKTDEVIISTSPMRTVGLKGCNDIQSLGGVETYSRRYLYMAAFDIVENDMFDGTNGDKGKEEKKPTPQKDKPKAEQPANVIALKEESAQPLKYACSVCGRGITKKLYDGSIEKYGKPYCSAECKNTADNGGKKDA